MDRQKEIEQIRSEIKACEVEIAARQREVGKRLRELGVRSSRSEALRAELEHVHRLLASIEEYRSDARKIQERIELAEQIRQQVRLNEEKISEANRQIAARNEELGRVAFEAYQKCPDGEKERFRGVFAEVLAIEEKVRKIQDEIDELERDRIKKGFFGRTFDLGKLGSLSIQRSWTGRGKDEALARIGAKLVTLDFHRSVPDEALLSIMSFVEAQQAAVKAAQEETASLRAKEVQIQEELHALGVAEGKPKTRLDEIETLCAKTQTELETQERECGKTWYVEKLHDETQDESLQRLHAMLVDLHARIQTKERQIERLKALDEIDTLERKAQELRAQKGANEEKIRQLTADIMRWEHDLEEIARKQTELRKVAEGP